MADNVKLMSKMEALEAENVNLKVEIWQSAFGKLIVDTNMFSYVVSLLCLLVEVQMERESRRCLTVSI
jgi:hypothetical protein